VRSRQPSEIPKSRAVWAIGAWLRRATAATSCWTPAGQALGTVHILPASGYS
jgi:hypothetical protein